MFNVEMDEFYLERSSQATAGQEGRQEKLRNKVTVANISKH